MKNFYSSWIGEHDLKSLQENSEGVGPIRAFLNSKYNSKIDQFHFLYTEGYHTNLMEKFTKFIKKMVKNCQFHPVSIKDPSDYGEIYQMVKNRLEIIKNGSDISWHFQTSSGTPQMSAIWLLLGKTIFPAKLYRGFYNKKTEEQIVNVADIPFDIELEYIPKIVDKNLKDISDAWKDIPQFMEIKFKSKTVENLLNRAYKVGKFDINCLIVGESGTGKELIAKAIHSASVRSKNRFEIVNCAAISQSVAESELFGYKKGAFTDAKRDKKGKFEICDKGIIFLDEIGELSLDIQAKLLRVIEYGEIQPVGGDVKKIDVKVLAATNRDLRDMVKKKKFREDLLYRLGAGIIYIPPLRERAEDIYTIAKYFLDKINEKYLNNSSIDYCVKKFSRDTKKIIKELKWRGNVRELYLTILRVCTFYDKSIITPTMLKEMMIENDQLWRGVIDEKKEENIDKKLPIDIISYLGDIERKYIKKALEVTANQKKKAAELLGYKNYQTLDNRLKKIEEESNK